MDSMDLYQNTASVSPFKGFWIRLVAFLLDSIILTIGVVLTFIVLIFTADSLLGAAAGGVFLIAIVLFIFAMFLYKPLMEASEYQGTFGKYLLGMKIVNQQGERITTTASFIRTIVYLLQTSIPFVNMISWLALVMIGFTEYKQGLHDIASGTFVVPHQWQGPVPVEDQFGA